MAVVYLWRAVDAEGQVLDVAGWLCQISKFRT